MAYRVFSFLIVIFILAACTETNTVTRHDQSLIPPQHKGIPLGKAAEVLAEGLIRTSKGEKVGRVGVTEFAGPGEEITELGEVIAEDLAIRLVSSQAFPDVVERNRLRDLLRAKKIELSGYFDQKTVQEFGNLIGMDSMVIGTIADLGSTYRISAKLVTSRTGRVLGGATAIIIKDSATVRMTSPRRATLVVNVLPPVKGTVIVGPVQASLINGTATINDLPYGPCEVIVQAEGYENKRKSIIIEERNKVISISLRKKTFDVEFQVIPPDASLTVDGARVVLSDEGFGRLRNLEAKDYIYVARAEGHTEQTGTFNPLYGSKLIINLKTGDPFHELRNSLFRKVQELRDNQKIRIDLKTSKVVYNIGDPVNISFSVDRDCYFYLVNVTGQGEVILLFPNQYHPDSFVSRNHTYRIPEDYNFSFEAEPPAGKEHIIALASTRPLDIFERPSGKPFITYTRGFTSPERMRNIGLRLKKAELGAAVETTIRIR